MSIDVLVTLAGLFVGFVVGLTGMGGGALMTPILVLFFGIQPLAAVSSDLVASMVMKPVGGLVHLRRGTVNRELVKYLVIGSVPFAFAGVLLLRALGDGESVQTIVKTSLGVALLVSATAMVVKALLTLRAQARDRAQGGAGAAAGLVSEVRVRPVPTIVIGAVGGLVVGMTSVGSGSLIIISLLLLYPTLRAQQLVGTDLVQAVPLVAAASVGHLLFGDFKLDLTASLLVGAIPGVYLGARVSSTTPGGLVRRALVVVLLASGLKLVGVSTVAMAAILLGLAAVGPVVWALVRNTSGFQVPAHRVDGVSPARLVVRAALGKPGSEEVAPPLSATDTLPADTLPADTLPADTLPTDGMAALESGHDPAPSAPPR